MVLQRKIWYFEQKFLSWKEFQYLLPEAIFDIYVAVNFLSQVIFIFSFVSTLSAYITWVKKINYNKYKLQVYELDIGFQSRPKNILVKHAVNAYISAHGVVKLIAFIHDLHVHCTLL